MSPRRRHPLPLTIVIELTAVTTFSRLRVPVFNEFGSAHGRHIRTLRIEGSSTPPDDGFAPLVGASGVNVIALPASGCEPGRIGA